MCRTMSDSLSIHRNHLCANRRCSCLVHTNPAYGGYCCRVCHWACVHRLVCLIHGPDCQGCEVLDPDSSPVERAPSHVFPECPLQRAWAPPIGDLLAAQECTRTHSVSQTYGVADVGGGVVSVDLCGSSSIRSASLVVLGDVAADSVCRRGMVSTTPLLPEPKMKPKDRRGRKRLWQDL